MARERPHISLLQGAERCAFDRPSLAIGVMQIDPADQQVEGRGCETRGAGCRCPRLPPFARAAQNDVGLGDFQVQRLGRWLEDALPVDHRTQTARLHPGEGKISAGQTELPRLQHAVFPGDALQIDIGPQSLGQLPGQLVADPVIGQFLAQQKHGPSRDHHQQGEDREHDFPSHAQK